LSKYFKGQSLAILGYGSQGAAQAKNLRDSGIDVVIGLPSKSKSRRRARRDGFKVLSSTEAMKMCRIISVLLPDHKQGEFFGREISASLLKGKTLIFAHGLSVAFGLVKLPKECDIILIAPHSPGVELRKRYRERKPITAFMAVKQNHSGNAHKIASAYAMAIGISSKGLFKSTFESEAIGDIFGEQTVLCGGLIGLIESGFNTLVQNGHSPESAYLECVYQLDLIVNLYKEHGPHGMLSRISKTAAYGALKTAPVLFDRNYEKKLKAMR
jgi:ketol-acid reductoisomerase